MPQEILLIGLIVASVMLVSAIVGIWFLARHGILWCYIPANTIGFVVTGEKDSEDPLHFGGGGIVDVVHEVPGKRLDKTSSNKFDWKLVDGEEDHGLLHFLLGIQWIGPARSVRINQIHDMCFQREPGKNPCASPKDYKTKFVYFSREQAIEVFGAKTIGSYRLDLPFNLLYNMIYPVRAILGVSDPNSVLFAMVREVVNNTIGTHEPEYFLHGDASHKQILIEAIRSINVDILEKIGISLTAVNLLNIDMDEESRKLFELAETTRRENEAAISRAERAKREAIIAAEGAREAGILANDVQEDHVKRVLVPTGEARDGALVRLAEAIENTDASTIALGLPVLPVLEPKK